MIFYSDEHINYLEKNNKWIESIDYLYQKWLKEKNDILLFRKTAINMWYTLTLDNIDINLDNNQKNNISKKLCEFYTIYQNNFTNDNTCEWLFGYMMEVQPILFLNFSFNIEKIENIGKNLIKSSSDKGNLIARILHSDKKLKKELKYNDLEKIIKEDFDSNNEIDKYFIEILKNCIN